MGHVIADDGVLRWLTAKVIARRFGLENERKARMGRLEEKLARVAGVAERITTHVETRADAVLEREPKLIARSEQVFNAKNSLLDDAERALDKVERAMGLISNDPLQASGGSPEDAPEPKQQLRDGVVMRSAS